MRRTVGCMIENAKWIAATEAEQAPCIEKKFSVSKVRSAILDITGLGYFYAEINGKNVTDDLFNPVFSDYRVRSLNNLLYPIADRMTHRVYFCRFNVADLLNDGDNVLSVYLGNGWYRQTKRTTEGHLEFGNKLIARFSLRYVDERGYEHEILSDGTEVWRRTEVTENNLFYGETQDLRVLVKTPEYGNVTVEDDFETAFTQQTCPAERVIRTIAPRLIGQSGKKRVYDAGETVSGRVRLRACGNGGDTVTVNHSERIAKDGTLDVNSSGGDILNDRGERQLQSVRYVLDGTDRELYPKFCKQAFRYFEVEGNADIVSVEVIHTDLPERTTFECGNGILNWLYTAYKRTQLINMHDGFPSDCPHRERLGYTGDGQITASAAMTMFDCEAFYRKWIRDICDCQNIDNGHVQHTAPFYGGGGGPVGWGGAVVQVPYAFYMHYGDKSLVQEALPHIAKWVDYIVSRTDNGLVCREENGGWCLGDWATLNVVIPQEFVNTTLFICMLDKAAFLAEEIGRRDLANRFSELQKQYRESVTNAFFDDETGSFAGGVQGADAFALAAGLGDRRTLDNLVVKYTEDCRFDTGFIGTYVLVEQLIAHGRVDVAFDLLSATKKGSFGYLKRLGETTIWEYLDTKWCSHAHPMFGAVAEFLPKTLLGFPDKERTNEVVLQPRFPRKLRYAEGSALYDGKPVEVRWKRTKNTIRYSVFVTYGLNVNVVYDGKTTMLNAGENELTIQLKDDKNE